MDFKQIYEIGKKFGIPLYTDSVDKKLKFCMFPYNSSAVFSTALYIFSTLLLAGMSLSVVFSATILVFMAFFFAVLVGVIIYIYPVHVFYTSQILEYKEEMLKAIMRISVFVLMKTSIEYAIKETALHSSGILKYQFEDVINRLTRKQDGTLGEVFEHYTKIWNEMNPSFVKALRLLETATLAKEADTKDIVNETIEDILLTYNIEQKRNAENLAEKTKKLVSMGVLFPIMLLMLLPMVSIFMPNVVSIGILVFMFDIIFPTILFVFALDFSSQRLQVDTIHIDDAPDYEPFETMYILISVSMVILFAIPTVVYLMGVKGLGASAQYSLFALIMSWLIAFGFFMGILIFTKMYTWKYRKIWNDVNDIEQDLPHLLQVFSTYLSLNMSVENIFSEIISDYKMHGYSKHPVVSLFSKLHHSLVVSKKTIEGLVEDDLPRICPSRKVANMIKQIVSFSSLSLTGASRATKTMRSQMVALYKLNDYIQTLLSESVGLINITVTMLAPLLSAISVIMSAVIVFFIDFLTKQLELISSIGGGEGVKLNLIDASKIIPPSVTSIIVAFYLLEIILVLSILESNIEIGFDKYKIAEKISRNILGFATYSAILFIGYYLFNNVFFSALFGP